MQLIPLMFLAPVPLVLVAILALSRGGPRPARVRELSQAATIAALALATVAVAQAAFGGAQSWQFGPGVVLRMDPVSATMALLVAFIGWVVMRYSATYLDGEAREGRFHGLMLLTLALVLVLVMAGHLVLLILAFAAIGLCLRQLLEFYPDRASARRAGAKFAWVWHGGDVALLAAAGLFWLAYGEVRLDALALAAQGGLTGAAHLAVGLLVLAAALKTAAFPVHGWLTEVMEAPTPVSALLHAGIINAGGVLLIRAAEIIQHSPGAMAALVILGGLTALFGAVVMLTQSAIKTALAWSTVAQMGFMLLQCGLGLWPLAMLHIVAHSLYKAHGFLSSGGAVQAVAALPRPGPVAVPRLPAVLLAFGLALAMYGAMAGLFTLLSGPKSPQALALGTMLILGVSYLLAQGLADAAPAALTKRTAQASAGAAVAYFGFQLLADALWGPVLPDVHAAGPLEWALIVLAVLSFGLVALAQALFPLWSHHPAAAGLRVHLANGLYLNALLDRLIGGFRARTSN